MKSLEQPEYILVLDQQEYVNLRSKILTSSLYHGGTRYPDCDDEVLEVKEEEIQYGNE